MFRLLPLLLVACGGPEGDDTSSPPDEGAPGGAPLAYDSAGPFPVGTETVRITGTDDLELTLQVWFPALEAGATTITYDGLLPGAAYEGVEPDCGEPRPVVAFSHGYGGVRYQSPFLTEHLASHGYVVVAPDHVGNTFVDLGGDFDELVVRRPQDIADAVDWLRSDRPDCVEEGYAAVGHSFGGYTALAAAGATVNDVEGGTVDLGDPRVWASVPLAPWDAYYALTDGTEAIAVPTLILTGERDETTPIAMVRSLWEPMTVQPRWLGVFPDAGHYSFSPIACVLESGDGCGSEFIDEATVTSLTNQAVLAFLEGIRADPAALEALPLAASELVWESVP